MSIQVFRSLSWVIFFFAIKLLGVSYVFWILTSNGIYSLQIVSPITKDASSLYNVFFLFSRYNVLKILNKNMLLILKKKKS